MSKTETPRHEKKVAMLREAIRLLGEDCSFPEAKRYCQQQYQMEIKESTFYAERKAYRAAQSQEQPEESRPMAITPPTPQARPSASHPEQPRAITPPNGPTPPASPKVEEEAEQPASPKQATSHVKAEEDYEPRSDDDAAAGIIELVKAGKLLVRYLGKEKAQELIDTL